MFNGDKSYIGYSQRFTSSWGISWILTLKSKDRNVVAKVTKIICMFGITSSEIVLYDTTHLSVQLLVRRQFMKKQYSTRVQKY